ncbi:MAG: SDR family oxidoreductase [Planctomycetes bacterium]|nr:SDR family oxidoreductase [Planctomycetota bacterium]MBI3845311.1 SDR family oxidoreductase [Planctomycetota bacterium]
MSNEDFILVTGATGIVGSAVCPLLAEIGYTIVSLARGGLTNPRTSTLKSQWRRPPGELRVVSGDVELPLCGVTDSDIHGLRGRVAKVLHCAASTRFEEMVPGDVWDVNVCGTEHAIDLADALGAPEFHLMSTAFVAGDLEELREDELDAGQRTRNAYEASKLESERLVHARRTGDFSVYRLAIVVGDSGSGAIPEFSGYYGFFSGFWLLKRLLAARWRRHRAQCTSANISFDDSGFLHIPCHIPCSDTSTLNLIPRDWMARQVVPLVAAKARGLTFHVTNALPPRVEDVIRWSMQALGYRDFTTGPLRSEAQTAESIDVKRVIGRTMQTFGAYVNHEAKFHQGNAVAVLRANVDPPTVSQSSIETLVHHAVSAGFGIQRKDRNGCD